VELVTVLGSGMAALGASWRLRQEGAPHVLYDRNGHMGGHTWSHADPSGFVFDEGPHISFTKNTRIQKLFAENAGGEIETFTARVNNYWRGLWIKHPAQVNLYGLPPDLLTKILVDMVEARGEKGQPANYAEWLVSSFGRTFAETFPMQYGRKYHTTEAANMSTDWLGPRLYKPSLEEVFRGALTPDTKDVHYIDEFRYPSRGGFVSFIRRFAEGIDLRLNQEAVAIDPRARQITFASGATARYEHLISSVPLPDLVALMRGVPEDVREAARRLACSTCVVVTIGLARADISDWHWTYFYDDEFVFSRISFPHLFSPGNCPPGMGSIQCELYFSEKYKPLTAPAESWIPRTIDDLRRCGLIRPDDRVVFQHALPVKYANVIFDLERAAAVSLVRGYLSDAGIQTCGRYGEWGYHWTDQSFVSGEQAAQRVLDSRTKVSVEV
jgi:protoporphyrinogen oxidase